MWVVLSDELADRCLSRLRSVSLSVGSQRLDGRKVRSIALKKNPKP